MNYISNSIAILLTLMLSSCGSFNKQIVRIKGSDTMLKLTQELAAEFMRLNPDISLYVEGGGSASGFDAMIEGDVDISPASRKIRPDEIKELAEKQGVIGMSYLVAKDALCIYINQANSIDNLSLGQLKEIFLGRITNWKEVGGSDNKIILATRPPNSGTHLYFKQHVLNGEDYFEDTNVKSSVKEMNDFIAKEKYAIGYGGKLEIPGIKFCAVNGIKPTEENLFSDKYELTRYLHYYVSNSPDGPAKKFLDWVLSADGQNYIKKTGYFPIFIN